MSDYQQKVSGTFNERMKLIRLRRKKENLHFWEEFRVVPRGLIWTVVGLYALAQIIGLSVNHWFLRSEPSQAFMPEWQSTPYLSYLGLAGVITFVSVFAAFFILLIGYVNRDARRRGMNSGLWTLLVIVLLPAWTFIGFLIYFLMREPLPYDCPQCGKSVGARYNYCPSCKCNLHPSCPNCKHEVVETDKYCPYCAWELGAGQPAQPMQPSASSPA
ncbi:MAG TPA: zinc ribbon domain-containing protein [Candidatus Acidoferrum sp.]|nr:zinc ribbon domain-containing protein [Candidatus Acidoferrum sp.]